VVLTRRETTYSNTVTGGKTSRPRCGARVRERVKRKGRVGDLLAEERCSASALDFLRSTHVRRAAPPVEGNWDSGDEEEEAVEAGEAEADGAEECAE